MTAPTVTPQLSEATALWSLAQTMSPRPTLRIDSWDSTTERWRHRYLEHHWPTEPPPAPYAIYLTDSRRRFRTLVFDLDTSRGDVAPDLHRLRDLLDTAGARYVVASSGPSGGRHVWLSLGHRGESPTTIRRLATLLATQLPTLDHGLLCNPATGAARPPGSPHRDGGHAQLLSPRDPDHAAGELADPNDGVVDKLIQLLLTAGTTPEKRYNSTTSHHRVISQGGGPALAGLRRPLNTRIQQALNTPVGQGDASAILASIFVAMALARWTVADVLPLVGSAPGLEHLRSSRSGSGRRRRQPAETQKLLRRQWDRCVRYAAELPPAAVDDTSNRALDTLRTITTIQDHLDATPQRWATQAGPADRGVLDALCLIALRACSCTIDLDVRRAGLLAGVSKSAAARALHRLQAHGDIRQIAPASGPKAARWRLLPPTSNTTGGTQGPRPPVRPREDLLRILQRKADIRSADLFAPRKLGGLGRYCGLVASLIAEPTCTKKLGCIGSYTGRRFRGLLDQLRTCGVVHQKSAKVQLAIDRLEPAARRCGIAGYRATQARMYALDREVFAWWREEEQWMRSAKRPQRPRGAEGLLFGTIMSRRRPFPRRYGRADFSAARNMLMARRKPTICPLVA